jgi:hypothetical protein
VQTDVVDAALDAHAADWGVALESLGFYRNLSTTPGNCPRLLASVPRAMAAVRTHAQDVGVLEEALILLWFMTTEDLSPRVAPYLPTVVAGMGAHPGEALVAQATLGILHNMYLVQDPVLQAAVRALAPLALTALLTHHGDPEVVRLATRYLSLVLQHGVDASDGDGAAAGGVAVAVPALGPQDVPALLSALDVVEARFDCPAVLLVGLAVVAPAVDDTEAPMAALAALDSRDHMRPYHTHIEATLVAFAQREVCEDVYVPACA